MHNTQEIKTIDFDDLDFLSQDNIFKNRFDTTYKNLSLRVKSIYERLLKNVYFNIITFSNSL